LVYCEAEKVHRMPRSIQLPTVERAFSPLRFAVHMGEGVDPIFPEQQPTGLPNVHQEAIAPITCGSAKVL
jgi:hypothetical protein